MVSTSSTSRHRGRPHNDPPSTASTLPLTKLEASEARKTAAPAISSGSATRPRALARVNRSLSSGLQQHSGECGANQARSDGVDPDAPGAELAGQNPGHTDERGLAHAVGTDQGVAADATDRGDVDDGAAMLSHPGLDGQPGHSPCPLEVHLPDLVERRLLGIQKRAELGVGGGIVTRMSSRPDPDTSPPTTAAQSWARPTWPGTLSARPPCASISATTRSHASELREQIPTAAPWAARAWAMARPIPRLPPVTRATLPRRAGRSPASRSGSRGKGLRAFVMACLSSRWTPPRG